MLTDQELRQAVFALHIIAERGNNDEFTSILRDASDSASGRPVAISAGQR